MNHHVRLGLYEKAMPGDMSVRDKLLLARRCGFDWMEISIDETPQKMGRVFDPDAAAAIAHDVRETGVPIDTMCLSGHRKFPLGEDDPMNLDLMFHAVDFARTVGIRLIQIAGYDTYYHPSTPETVARFGENFVRAVDYAASHGVCLGFETMETPFMNSTEKAMKYVSAVGSPWLGVYPDVGNVTNAVPDTCADLLTGRGHIFAAHLKDTKPGIFRDLEFGEGRVDFDACVRTLLSMGVRMFNCEFWYDGHTDPETYVRRNADYVKAVFART